MIPRRTSPRRAFLAAAIAAAATFCGLANAAPPAAPTNFTVEAPFFQEFQMAWEDNASDEDNYRLDLRLPPETAWTFALNFSPDFTGGRVTGGNGATTYEFRIVAVNADGEASSQVATVTTPDSFSNGEFSNAAPYTHINLGEPFSFTPVATNSSGATTVTYSASPLPDGVTIDTASGVISGTPTEDGYFDVIVEAAFDPTAPSARDRIALRIPPLREIPRLLAPLPAPSMIAGESETEIPLADHFEDPDTALAIKMETSQGDMVFSLFDRATPEPVANFLSYVDRGTYSANIFHRSVNESTFDIIQSGSYSGDGSGLSSHTLDPPIRNAPGIPNDRGTLAFARTNDPDSATSGWYINAQDSPGLDTGNSYAVFGRATDTSLAVIDAIFAIPTGAHSILIDGNSQTLDTLPTTDGNPPTTPPDPNNLIIVNSISRIPALTYTLDSNSTPTVADAALVDSELTVTPLVPGTTEISITATDIDGNDLTQTFTVTVLGTYAAWIAGENIAPKPEGLTDHPGGGPFNNLQSYAFGGAAADGADDADRAPSTTTADVETVPHDSLCFYHRKYASDLSYRVETTTDLATWSTVWESADGNEAPAVVSAVDHGDFWKITVRKDTPAADDDAVYFRVAVTHPGT